MHSDSVLQLRKKTAKAGGKGGRRVSAPGYCMLTPQACTHAGAGHAHAPQASCVPAPSARAHERSPHMMRNMHAPLACATCMCMCPPGTCASPRTPGRARSAPSAAPPQSRAQTALRTKGTQGWGGAHVSAQLRGKRPVRAPLPKASGPGTRRTQQHALTRPLARGVPIIPSTHSRSPSHNQLPARAPSAPGSAASSCSCASHGCFSASCTVSRRLGSNCSRRSSKSIARGSASGNFCANGTRCGVGHTGRPGGASAAGHAAAAAATAATLRTACAPPSRSSRRVVARSRLPATTGSPPRRPLPCRTSAAGRPRM